MLSSSHTASTRLSRSIISQPVRAFFFSPFDVDTKNRGHFLPPALWPRDITGIKHKLSWPRPFSSSDFKHKLSHGSRVSLSPQPENHLIQAIIMFSLFLRRLSALSDEYLRPDWPYHSTPSLESHVKSSVV